MNNISIWVESWACVCVYIYTDLYIDLTIINSTNLLITCRLETLCVLFGYCSTLYYGFHNDKLKKYCLRSRCAAYRLILHATNTHTHI
jgi:hypothetical protein